MWNRILGTVTVIIALILAIMAVSLSPDKLKFVIMVSRFFEVMIPVLAVGALMRYLTYCPHMPTWNTVLSGCIFLIAIILAIMAVTLSPTNINIVILISRFFEVMLPIFGVGALVKYLTNCRKCCHKHECEIHEKGRNNNGIN